MMPISQQKPAAAALVSLYIDALRQGQSLWFRMASGSMSPTLRVGDEVRIEPTTANEILFHFPIGRDRIAVQETGLARVALCKEVL